MQTESLFPKKIQKTFNAYTYQEIQDGVGINDWNGYNCQTL